MNSNEIEHLKEKTICYICVTEGFLAKEIERGANTAVCDYCDDTGPCMTLDELSRRVETAFDEHFVRTSNEPESWEYAMMADKESSYEWYRSGDSVIDAIAEAAGIPHEAASDIQSILDDEHGSFESQKMGDETDFSPDSYYEQGAIGHGSLGREWQNFEHELKTEARFFNRAGAGLLASIFDGIDKLSTVKGKPLITVAGPGHRLSKLYRARVFQADSPLEDALKQPGQHLGPPPSRLASAGRMNARGISVFYGATTASTAIAEVRPPVGSRVAVACFGLIRPVRLLDLTALKSTTEEVSLFDPATTRRLARMVFLRTLEQRMTRPVMPEDEAFDYLVTQAIADYLSSENDPPLDGIIFPSVQTKNARNVVLFQKSSRVEPIEVPLGTTIEVSTGYHSEEGWETQYSVTEKIPKSPSNPPKLPWRFPSDEDGREYTLQVDPTSVRVHHIEAVKFTSNEHSVDRYKFAVDEHQRGGFTISPIEVGDF